MNATKNSRPHSPIANLRCPKCDNASVRQGYKMPDGTQECGACGLTGQEAVFAVHSPFVINPEDGYGMIHVTSPDGVSHAKCRVFGLMYLYGIAQGEEPRLQAFQDDLLFHDAKMLADLDCSQFIWIVGRSHTRFIPLDEWCGWNDTVIRYDTASSPADYPNSFFLGNVMTGNLEPIAPDYASRLYATVKRPAA